MADITEVRARLKDRQVKEGALGTVETFICLDLGLIEALDRANADLDSARNLAATEQATGKPRLGSHGKPESDPEVIKAQRAVAAAEGTVRKSSLRLVFRALSSVTYQQLMNDHPDANNGGQPYTDFLNALLAECLREAWSDDDELTKDGLSWQEIANECSYGEWELTSTEVMALNRRKVDVPFSSRPSKKVRR